MTKGLKTWIITLVTLASGLLIKDGYVFTKEMFWAVKNTPAQDKMIQIAVAQGDTIIKALRDGYVKKTYFVHHIKRDSSMHAELNVRINRLTKNR